MLSRPKRNRHFSGIDGCERDCVLTVRELGKPCRRREIMEEMAQMGRCHGASTIRMALAKLVRDGVLTRRKRGRASEGYGLPEWDTARS
jgi:hypothetical protein